MKTTIEQVEDGYVITSDERTARHCGTRDELMQALRKWFPLSEDDAAILFTLRERMVLDDDLEVDDDASISPTDEGTWVQSWVWVADESEDD